jgi:DNA-binding CsgD family transcriptional regulator
MVSAANNINAPSSELRLLTMAIPPARNETALLGVAARLSASEWTDFKASAVQDLRVLATYFHSHVLRLHGIDAAGEMIVSARELDCLKWTAAGKTAWEASRILGISERTVRFHLNSAREKLNCANTTQAVAVAVSQRMIAI